jgi:hypothetical protein
LSQALSVEERFHHDFDGVAIDAVHLTLGLRPGSPAAARNPLAKVAGELQAIMDVFKWRQISELIPRGYKFPIGDNPFPVFDANVGKIGFLPADLAVKVAGFYGYAGGIVQDLGTINSEKIAK